MTQVYKGVLHGVSCMWIQWCMDCGVNVWYAVCGLDAACPLVCVYAVGFLVCCGLSLVIGRWLISNSSSPSEKNNVSSSLSLSPLARSHSLPFISHSISSSWTLRMCDEENPLVFDNYWPRQCFPIPYLIK